MAFVLYSVPDANELRKQVEEKERRERHHSKPDLFQDTLLLLTRKDDIRVFSMPLVEFPHCGGFLDGPPTHVRFEFKSHEARHSGHEMLISYTAASRSSGGVFATLNEWNTMIMPMLQKAGFVITPITPANSSWIVSLY